MRMDYFLKHLQSVSGLNEGNYKFSSSLKPEHRKAYEDGKIASRRGDPVSSNPHPKKTALHKHWETGHSYNEFEKKAAAR